MGRALHHANPRREVFPVDIEWSDTEVLDVAHRGEEKSHAAEAHGEARQPSGRVAQNPGGSSAAGVLKKRYVAAPIMINEVAAPRLENLAGARLIQSEWRRG